MILNAQTLLFIEALLFGLVVGSFLNVCIYRLPLNKSLGGRSFCPCCQKPIPFYWNIPVLSFLLQRGKSACCKKKISWQYPTVEMLTGFISIITLHHVLHHERFIADYFIWFCLFMCPLIVITFIDFEHMIIPDSISLPFIVVGTLVTLYSFWPNWKTALIHSGVGIIAGGGILWLLAEIVSRLKKRDAMGGGDIKLAAMLGAFLGWKALIFIFFASSVLGLVYAVYTMIFKKNRERIIPFGPFLSLAAMIFWLYGRVITDAYFISLMKLGKNPLF
jgi:leader peptidase (prepilin peptidase)/N-methyltransferase